MIHEKMTREEFAEKTKYESKEKPIAPPPAPRPKEYNRRDPHTVIKLIAAEKPTGTFIAIYDDHSAGSIFKRLDNGVYLESEGFEVDYNHLLDAGYYAWIKLPDSFELFCELENK